MPFVITTANHCGFRNEIRIKNNGFSIHIGVSCSLPKGLFTNKKSKSLKRSLMLSNFSTMWIKLI